MRKCTLVVVLVLAAGLAAASLSGARGQTGDELTQAITVARVVAIGDGWLELSYISGHETPFTGYPTFTFHFYLIDFDPYSNCYYYEAIKYLWDSLYGRTVWLVHYPESRNPHNAFVYLDSELTTLYQAIIVSQGFATVRLFDEEEEPFRAVMEQLQEEARNAGRGQWGACP